MDRHMGRTYGRWTLLEFSHQEGKRAYFYKAVCECGTESTVRISNLQQGISKSCGCYGREIRRTANLGNTTRRKGYGESAKNHLYSKYRLGALKRKLSFDLSPGQFHALCKGDCFYCGREPSSINRFRHGYGEYVYNGLDRVDNALGYHPENCVPCCAECNTKKGAMTREMIAKAHCFLALREIAPAPPIAA